MSTELPYRPCVGIALFNDDNHVFVGERIDNPGAWQMPQGGIDEGETVEDAFFREMEEEIGSTLAEIIRVHDTPLRYELPPHLLGKLWNGQFGGQEQIWVAARFMGLDSDINIHAHRQPEFQAWQWAPLDQILDLIVPFKRNTYAEVITAFKDIV
ncbi:MAG TPA: RNA pyrophosphohydrolase [Micavibrio sp.]|nr:RNA pyrophosphohydrolase [Pseudomonadota bacterium]MEC8664164.1 RNA pyrophosphohydrolase [Pseudomonadota bacterium]HIF26696.1 RNA pyrophosphohydrolase [Micavibrio sp.]HIL28712.1 RNA pyrophosphohydrolase [Micavibrio sp.]|tara:strand:+ start:528 stop:992 length:465 start_codon:yes stop_codon:yes gene_type:complete